MIKQTTKLFVNKQIKKPKTFLLVSFFTIFSKMDQISTFKFDTPCILNSQFQQKFGKVDLRM